MGKEDSTNLQVNGSATPSQEESRPLERQHFCGLLGKVDNAALDERPTVVDAHDNRAVPAFATDADACAKRQRLVRRGQGLRVVDLAVCRFLS